jgi:tRNA (mo5U34)-methyltransferase
MIVQNVTVRFVRAREAGQSRSGCYPLLNRAMRRPKASGTVTGHQGEQNRGATMTQWEPEEVARRVAKHPHWYHQIEVAPGIVTPGINDSAQVLGVLGLPEDCSGMRALDIGARDGFFSFELERRGAEVLALDYIAPEETGFLIARELLGSKVEYQVGNVYDLTPERFGQFDIVLFLGVLYHLRNPLLAIDRVRSVCRGSLWLESQVIDEALLDPATGALESFGEVAPRVAGRPMMQFYPRDSLNSDFTNWWAPNLACLVAMLEEANFTVERQLLNGSRGIVVCNASDDTVLEYYRSIESSVVPRD